MVERDGGRRGSAVRFTLVRRAAALRVVAETGNKRAAAEAAGVDVTTIERWLKKDPAFAAAWEAAADAAHKRLAAARSPFEGVADGRFETIQRARTGRLQIQAVRPGRWTKAIEDRFFAALRTCGNMAACARLAGFSEKAIWDRRDKWPAFAARMDKALDEAEIALEFRLACLGNNVGAGMDEEGEGEPSVIASDAKQSMDCHVAGAPRNDGGSEVPFDPEFALKYLKWREEKRRGLRRSPVGAPPPIEEVSERIARRVQAIKRHRRPGDGEGESNREGSNGEGRNGDRC
jgi:hypothetical protein